MHPTFTTASPFADSYPAHRLSTDTVNPIDCHSKTACDSSTSRFPSRPHASTKWRASFQQQSSSHGVQSLEDTSRPDLKRHQRYQVLTTMVFKSLDKGSRGFINIQDLHLLLISAKNAHMMCLQTANALLMRISCMSAAAVTLAEFFGILASCQACDQESLSLLLQSLLLHQQSVSQDSAASIPDPPATRSVSNLHNAPQLSASIVLSSSLFSSSECSSSECSSQRSSFDVPVPGKRMQLSRLGSCTSNASTTSNSTESSKRSSLDDGQEDGSTRPNAYATLTAAKVRLHGLSHKHKLSKSRPQTASITSASSCEPNLLQDLPILDPVSAPCCVEESPVTEAASPAHPDALPVLPVPCLHAEPVSWPLSSSQSDSLHSVDLMSCSDDVEQSSDMLSDRLRHEDLMCHISMEALVFAPAAPSPRQDGNFLDSNSILELPLVQTLLFQNNTPHYS